MYSVNKIVGWVFSPFGILFLGLAVGYALRKLGNVEVGKLGEKGRKRCRVLGAWCIGLTLGLTWFFGTPYATIMLGVPLEGEEPPMNGAATQEEDGYDAIVLLGGGMGAHEECGRMEAFSGADRVVEAARLLKCGKAPVMTLSGGGVENSTVPLLVELGVDKEKLLYFPEARNTEEEARMISERGIKRIALVTSAWHMRRAKMLFERAGFEVAPFAADWEMHYVKEEPFKFGNLFPYPDAFSRNSAALKEWIGLLGYSIKR